MYKKKRLRQFISIFTAIALVLMLIPASVTANNGKSFDDVNKKYAEAVNELVQLGIVHGYEDGTFRPDQAITREQGIAMIIRELGLKTEKKQNLKFKDVKPGQRFYEEIAVALDNGIIDGKSADLFGYGQRMTRAEMTKVLMNAFELEQQEGNSVYFDDVPETHWAYPYIMNLVSNGIVMGYEDHTFKPDIHLTRLHFSLFISRYIRGVKKQKEEPAEPGKTPDLLHLIELTQSDNEIVYGEQLKLELKDLAEDLVYEAEWSSSGGRLTVGEDGKSAIWEPSLNSHRNYTILVKIKSVSASNEAVSFVKQASVSVEKRNISRPLPPPVPSLVPFIAEISFDKPIYLSGEEVIVEGVLRDPKGQAVPNQDVKLDDITTVTDSDGKFVFSFLAIDETYSYHLYAEEKALKVKIAEAEVSDSFQIAIDTEKIDLQPDVIGLNSETMENLTEFIPGEKAVFEGVPASVAQLSVGTVFVTAPTEDFPLGTSGKVTEVDVENGTTIVSLTDPELAEMFSELEVEGIQPLQVENIMPNEGVEVFTSSDVPDDMVRTASIEVTEDKITFSIAKELINVSESWSYSNSKLEADGNGEFRVDANGKLTLQNTNVEYDISLLEASGELILTNEQVVALGITSNVNGEGEVRVNLGEIFIPIQGPVGITGSLWMVAGVNGEITFEITYNQTTELKIGARVNGSEVDGIGNFDVLEKKFTSKAQGKATARIGFKPNLFLSVYTVDFIGLDNEFGLSSDITATIEYIGTSDERACRVTEEKMYANSYGEVKEVMEGKIKLFTWEKSIGKTDTCPLPQELTVSPADEYVKKGEALQLEVRGITKEGEERDYTPKKEGTSYVSSDLQTASVDENGLVTVSETAAVGKEFTITATNNEKEAVASFKVIEIEKIQLTPKEIKIPAGGKQLVAVDAVLTNGETLRMNDEKLPVQFTIENENIAGVSSYGDVIAAENNLVGITTTLTARYGEFEDTATIEIIPDPDQEGEPELSIIPTSPAAAGYKHSVYVESDGTVWTWGDNEYGQLGTGDTENSLVPKQVSGLPKITAVAAGFGHSLALAENGTVWAWGNNNRGQLGTGTNDATLTPVQVTGIENALSIAVGALTSYAIMTDGSVKAWGYGNNGLLGNNSENNSNVPVTVHGLTGIVSIDSSLNYFGERHTIALEKNGDVWTWGDGYFCALGSGPHLTAVWNEDALVPIKVAGLNSEGNLTDIIQVEAGDTHSLALGRDGRVYGWGNGWGNEQFSSVNHPVQKLNSDGSLLQEVIGISAAGYQENNVLKADGSIWSWEESESPALMPELKNVLYLSTGGYHSFAITEDNGIWARGWNDQGQLGTGTTSWSQSQFVQVKK